MMGFRRCQAPYCRVSRTRTVWPREYRMAVPIWGRVHLECRSSPWQLRNLLLAQAFRRVTISFQVGVEPMRRAIESIQRMMIGLQLPEHELYEREWETAAHHWTPPDQDR
jgi:hypothetical protein